MQYRNTIHGYGAVARALHWIMALAIFGLFGLGYWMRTLSYYSPYYKSAVDLHQSIGIVLLFTLVFRLIWKVTNPSPNDDHLTKMEHRGASAMHWGFYGILLAIMISGYFISTLDGRSIPFFGFVDVPSIITSKGLEETAGQFHWILAYATIGLALLHAATALWHHFVKRDPTLVRMIKPTHPTNGEDNV